MGQLGDLFVDAAAIRAIVKEANDMVSQVEGILKAAETFVKELANTSEGGFIDTLKNIWDNLSNLFANLIKAFRQIFSAIDKALTELMNVDVRGANDLRGAYSRSA